MISFPMRVNHPIADHVQKIYCKFKVSKMFIDGPKITHRQNFW